MQDTLSVSVFLWNSRRSTGGFRKEDKVNMDPAIIPITTVIGSVLSSLKNARDLAKDTTNSELRSEISDAYDALLDLKSRLFEMDEEIRQLKTELAKRGEIEGPRAPFGYFYRKGDHEHPLCPKCYQSSELKVSFLTPPNPWNGGIRRDCRICGLTVWEKEMELGTSRVQIGRRLPRL